MVWMISANGKLYDHASSFATNGFIDWRQRAKYEIGDIVYIYCTRPFKKIMYKCEVISHSMSFSECVDDAKFWIDKEEYEKSKSGFYARLKLLEQVDTERLSLDILLDKGLHAAPQGPIKVDTVLNDYIDSCFNDFYADGFYPDVDGEKDFHEGHVRSVMVNVYERSSIARGKCIDYHGDSCLICGINFGDKYGELGRGFIHIHHLKPLYTIRKDYIVNYKDDLIPVCPNCHAMIHRIPNGENMTIEQIRRELNYTRGITEICNSVSTPPNINARKEKSNKNNTTEKTVVSSVKVGANVIHKAFGNGVVKKIDLAQNYLTVSFPIGEKIFVIPDALEKGYLKINND